MKLDARAMVAEPESVEEAWRWIEMILGEPPHGRTAWDIEQHLSRARDLGRWIREQTDALLPLEQLFSEAE